MIPVNFQALLSVYIYISSSTHLLLVLWPRFLNSSCRVRTVDLDTEVCHFGTNFASSIPSALSAWSSFVLISVESSVGNSVGKSTTYWWPFSVLGGNIATSNTHGLQESHWPHLVVHPLVARCSCKRTDPNFPTWHAQPITIQPTIC